MGENESARGTALAQANVLLCGATGGIGRQLAQCLAGRGAQLTLTGRSAGRLSDLEAIGRTCVADLTQPGACSRVIDAAREHGGGQLDVIINAAGVVTFGPVIQTSEADISTVLDINVAVPMLLARAGLPHLTRGGTVVNISAVVAEPGKASAEMALYSASKGALRAFDEALAREARRVGVHHIDARPPHTETGLINRPVSGRAPRLRAGLDPAHVAAVICDAIEAGTRDLPSEAFT